MIDSFSYSKNRHYIYYSLEILARAVNSFGELFLFQLKTEQKYDVKSGILVYLIRYQRLALDYLTELSELQMPFEHVPMCSLSSKFKPGI